MASLKYRCITPGAKTEMRPVAASQYFYHNGINFVYMDGSGHLTLALTATATLYGWALVPAGRGAGTSDLYWKSSATAGADVIPVITVGEGAQFILPADDTATQAMIGNACDIIAVNDGTATTVDVGTSSTDVLLITGIGTTIAGGAATDVIVKMNPAKVQADT
ncbi:MAG: hypothetical protein NUV80_05735 [Candidatus Berkelbacteria bacterium]|nr:hypothetical protein [Candidatus Berkelbacteria bacterium]